MYLTYLILLGLTIVFNSILLVIFYRHTQRNGTTISLFILLLLVNIWFIPKFLTNALHPGGFWFETFSRISALGYIFVPVVLLYFCLSFGVYNRIINKLSFWIILLIPPIVFLYLSWTSNLVGVHNFMTAKLYPWGYETPTGKFWVQYILWYDIIITLAVGILIQHYRTMIDQSKKRQTLYFIILIIVPLVIDTFTVELLPIFNIFIFPIGLILLDVVTIIGIALIYRYGLFEVSAVTILSSINHAILTVDNKGRIIQINPYAEKIFNLKVSQLIGTPIDKIIHIKHKDNNNRNHCMQLLRLVLNKGKSITFKSFSIYINKKQKLTETISISPIYSELNVIGANIFLSDTRKERELETQKDNYFNMVFHELKTPLTSIKAYNQLLLKKLKYNSNDNKKLIINIDTQLDRLTRLINDFFEISRMHAGKLTLKKEFFDVDELIQGVIDTFKIIHKERVFRVDGRTAGIVYADKDKIEQILINFLNNAIKFSPDNKEIVIHLTSDQKRVKIGIQDHGKGIDPKFHKKVFDRFFQLGANSKEKIGLGIGLFIASTIVKAHGGRIWVNSKIGKGSTFYFTLPTGQILHR